MKNTALVILAGSGMSADSNLETFYTGKKVLDRTEYIDFCSIESFRNKPSETWKYWFQLQSRYDNTIPHKGYSSLRNYIENNGLHHHVITTNGDGLFRKSGFENVVEIHGNLNQYSCTELCSSNSYPIRNLKDVPSCPNCNGTTRPSLYLFDDLVFSNQQTSADYLKYIQWIKSISESELIILEIGVGNTVKTLKREISWLKRTFPTSCHLNINPYENTSEGSKYFQMTADAFLTENNLVEVLDSNQYDAQVPVL